MRIIQKKLLKLQTRPWTVTLLNLADNALFPDEENGCRRDYI